MHSLFRVLLTLFLLSTLDMLQAQNKPAYLLFDAKGKSIKYRKMIKHLGKAEVILFGELHNNPIAHWLELEMLIDLQQKFPERELQVGAEMFETHQQKNMDALFAGDLKEEDFEKETDLWSNYPTDYRPILRFCKEGGIPLSATNVPRRWARMVSKEGPESLANLSEKEQQLLPPLPYPIDYELPSYAAMKDLMGGHGGGMNLNYFIAAQAIKDASMAHQILQSFSEDVLYYHLNGSYHSDNKEGIAWYLEHYRPGTRIQNITVVEQSQLNSLSEEHLGKADFIILVPSNMTKTYLTGFE
ncbi:MAG: ChaN family lipoprotein [Bacteroidota bacterium]